MDHEKNLLLNPGIRADSVEVLPEELAWFIFFSLGLK